MIFHFQTELEKSLHLNPTRTWSYRNYHTPRVEEFSEQQLMEKQVIMFLKIHSFKCEDMKRFGKHNDNMVLQKLIDYYLRPISVECWYLGYLNICAQM